MKRVLLGVACLIIAMSMFAEGSVADDGCHTFTSSDGRTIQAKIIEFDSSRNKVRIKRDNGKLVWVPIDAFSENDQTYVREWHISTILFSNSNLAVAIDKKTGNSDSYHKVLDGWQSHYPGIKYNDVTYSIKIDNRSNIPLGNLSVDYRIYYQSKRKEKIGESELRDTSDGHKGWFSIDSSNYEKTIVPFFKSGNFVITELAKQKSFTTLTDKVRLRKGTEAKYGNVQGRFRSYQVREIDDEVMGLILRISAPLPSGGWARKEYSYPSDLMESITVDWDLNMDGGSSAKALEEMAMAAVDTGQFDKAVDYMRQAVDSEGTVVIQYGEEAYKYAIGKGVEQDYRKAFKLYLKAYASNSSNASGAIWIGGFYRDGNGVERDHGRAISWYQRAIERGHSAGYVHLINLYLSTDDPAHRNAAKAVKYADQLHDIVIDDPRRHNELIPVAKAYAQVDRFDDAVRLQQQVIKSFVNREKPVPSRLLEECMQQLEAYKRHEKPYVN